MCCLFEAYRVLSFVPLYLAFFSTWNFLSPLCHGEAFLILRGPFQCYRNSEALLLSSFTVELTTLFFLLPSTLFLFYYTTASCALVTLGRLSAFTTQPWPPWAHGLYVTHFMSSLEDMLLHALQITSLTEMNCRFPVWSLSPFVLWTGPASAVSARRAIGNPSIPGLCLCPLLMRKAGL